MQPTCLHLAKHLRDFHVGGNWTVSNLKDQLEVVDLPMALKKHDDFNTIATLSFHIHYFVVAAIGVLEGKGLNAHDKYSFEHPEFKTEMEWQDYKQTIIKDGLHLADLIETLSDETLFTYFEEEKYGTYFRNLAGTIEHGHYHLGQIAFLKKLLAK